MGSATAVKPKKKGKSVLKTNEGKFVDEYLNIASEEVETVAVMLQALSKRERKEFYAVLIEMCEDYADALYGDDDEDDDECFEDECFED